jgi:hypothetical protein
MIPPLLPPPPLLLGQRRTGSSSPAAPRGRRAGLHGGRRHRPSSLVGGCRHTRHGARLAGLRGWRQCMPSLVLAAARTMKTAAQGKRAYGREEEENGYGWGNGWLLMTTCVGEQDFCELDRRMLDGRWIRRLSGVTKRQTVVLKSLPYLYPGRTRQLAASLPIRHLQAS